MKLKCFAMTILAALISVAAFAETTPYQQDTSPQPSMGSTPPVDMGVPPSMRDKTPMEIQRQVQPMQPEQQQGMGSNKPVITDTGGSLKISKQPDTSMGQLPGSAPVPPGFPTQGTTPGMTKNVPIMGPQGALPQQPGMSQQGPLPQQGAMPQQPGMPQQGAMPQQPGMPQQGTMPQQPGMPQQGTMPTPQNGMPVQTPGNTGVPAVGQPPTSY